MKRKFEWRMKRKVQCQELRVAVAVVGTGQPATNLAVCTFCRHGDEDDDDDEEDDEEEEEEDAEDV